MGGPPFRLRLAKGGVAPSLERSEDQFVAGIVGQLHPDLLERSDVVVMAAPLTAETRSMLGAVEFARMKPSAYFINVGRGATVDELVKRFGVSAAAAAGATWKEIAVAATKAVATTANMTFFSIGMPPWVCGSPEAALSRTQPLPQ